MTRTLSSSGIAFPDPVEVVKQADRFVPQGLERPITYSNIDKVFFPDEGYTKGDLIQYCLSVSRYLLPHLRERPISMSRYPDGITGESFYQKNAPGHQPEWMPTAPIDSESQGGLIEFLLADSSEGPSWFANMGCIEFHPFHSRQHTVEFPDYAIFDLDPAEGSTWDQVVSTARLLNVFLGQLNLVGYPKLSGSRGIHVYVPLEPVHSYDRVRRFTGEVGGYLAAANPDDITMVWEKKKRTGRVFVDHNRNAFGQTIAAVYSVRPRPGAPVSVPLQWEEVGELANGDVTIANVWERLEKHGDLFAPVLEGGQTLDAAEEKMGLTPWNADGPRRRGD